MRKLNESVIYRVTGVEQMKALLTIICVSLLFYSCDGGRAVKKEKTDDWTAMGLKGKVKKITEQSTVNELALLYTFSEKGYLNEKGRISSWPQSKTVITERFEYDDNGKLSCISYYSGISGDLEKKQLYNNDQLMEEQKFTVNYGNGNKKEPKLVGTQFYIYDEEGLLIKSQTSEDDQSRVEFESDIAGNVLKKTSYFMGKVGHIYKFLYKYDKHGNVIQYTRFHQEMPDAPNGKEGEIDYAEERKFDDNGLRLEQSNITYNYNKEKGNHIRQKMTFTYQYDEQGNPTEVSCITHNYTNGEEEERSDLTPTLTTYTYVYDKHGNWTSREEKYEGKVQYTVTRSYIYYGEEPPVFSEKEMVGVWDYYSDPKNKIEVVFKKGGTFIDYIDFHSTGTYKINPDGTVITMQFFYNDGENSQKSKPMDFKILEYAGDRLTVQCDGGTPLIYERKAKSDNYSGEL